MEWLKKALESLKGRSNGKRIGVLVVIGFIGILLIGLSEWFPRKAEDSGLASDGVPVTAQALESALEERITSLLSQVQGVGNCRVMVTLENGVQQVYATEESHSTATDTSSGSQRVLTVDTADGPVGLAVTEIQPVVRGVAVVCAGGADPEINRQVTELIATAFNISSRRVCVAKGY